MSLLKLTDFDPDYREVFGNDDIKGMGVYTEGTEEKIGSISDVLVDEAGHFRYLVVDLGFWIFGKKILLPLGRARIDYNNQRIYTTGLSKEQAEALPEFSDRLELDYDYEEQVRGVYRPNAKASASNPMSATMDSTPSSTPGGPQLPSFTRDTYNYHQEPALYGMNEQDHQTFKLYEERLIANKQRVKTGEVAVGKRIETETARVSVPVEKERVIIERNTPIDAGNPVAVGEADFLGGEVARIELYEETPDIHKEAFVREEVRVKKVVDRDTVDAQETIRREELDVTNNGETISGRSDAIRSDKM